MTTYPVTIRIASPLTPREQRAVALARDAFGFGRWQPCWASPSEKLFHVEHLAAPLTPQERVAVETLRRSGWRVVTGCEYILGHGERYAWWRNT